MLLTTKAFPQTPVTCKLLPFSRQPSLVTAQPALLVYVLLRPLPPAAALAHPLAYDGLPLCVVDVGWQQEFLGQDHRCLQWISSERCRKGEELGQAPGWNDVSLRRARTVFSAALECTHEASAKSIVHPDELRVRVGGLFVTRLRQLSLAVPVWWAAPRLAVGRGHRRPDEVDLDAERISSS